MSYLDVPRLVFFGQFHTDPSTVNNDPEHFDTDAFEPNYWKTGTADNLNGWWNPKGTGTWRCHNVVITSATYADGTTCTSSVHDPLIGANVRDANDRVAGRLVDLDPEQQMISQLWGLQLRIEVPRTPLGCGGALLHTGFSDIWARFPGGNGDGMFSASFQTVIEDPWWGTVDGSRALTELRAAYEAAGEGAALSVRLVVDGWDGDATSPSFMCGRMSGAIGVSPAREPRRLVAARRFDAPAAPPGSAPSTFNGGSAQLVAGSEDGRRPAVLTVDLGNSLAASALAGAFADAGDIEVALLGPPSSAPTLLAPIPYREGDWYQTTSGIVSVPLTAADAETAAAAPIAIVETPSCSAVLSEAPDGIWVRADENVFRMNPGDELATTLYATKFGAVLAGQPVSLALDPSNVQMQQVAGPIPGPPTGVPPSALAVDASVATDDRGRAEVVLRASDPGNPRGYIDGQVYGVTYGAGTAPPPPGAVQNTSSLLNVLVWSGVEVPEQPTWLRDIEPIFTQYAYLYPVMKPIVDLADYASVVQRRELLLESFTRTIDDPGFMPVTRDLSAAKRDMIVRWLGTCRYMAIDSVDDLVRALQRAIELEHATIPPYLCALYSLKPGRNVEIAGILRGIVIEEMLHLTLIANLLTSLGRSADLGRPGFVPIYPGPLPGGLIAGLTVRLRPCSIPQIRDVFMAIEQGYHEIEPVRGRSRPGDPIDATQFTIGWFYDEIERSLVDLHEAGKITFGHADRQVTRWPAPGRLAPITDLAEARAALAEIRHQGEGHGPLAPGDGDHELAHYYRFAQIVHGRRLVPHANGGGFSYDGEVIPFDEDGVHPMADDPDLALLQPGSHAATLAQQFRHDYRALLRALHGTFNGEPDSIHDAMSLMYALDVGARHLMQIPLPDDATRTVGPVF